MFTILKNFLYTYSRLFIILLKNLTHDGDHRIPSTCKKNKYGKPNHPIKTIGVLGGGLMGAGISAVSINKNYSFCF